MRHEPQFSPNASVGAFFNDDALKDETLRFLQAIPSHLYTPHNWGRPGHRACLMTHLGGWSGVKSGNLLGTVALRLNMDVNFLKDMMAIFDTTPQPQAKAVALVLFGAIPVGADTAGAQACLGKTTLREYLKTMRLRLWEKGPATAFLLSVLPARLALAVC